MRLPSEEQHSLLYFDRSNGYWKYTNLAKETASNLNAKLLSAQVGTIDAAQEYVLFERRNDRYFVIDTSL
jgi:hypothetical protein